MTIAVVPARAGVILCLSALPLSGLCGPRASGGDPYIICYFSLYYQWSPRERG